MSPDHLTLAHPAGRGTHRSHAVIDGVRAALAGTPVDQVAASAGIPATELTEAIRTYHRAGSWALEAGASHDGWYQANIRFADWAAAETQAVTHLLPGLRELHARGHIAGWWFIRKAPCWRLRIALPGGRPLTSVAAPVGGLLDQLATRGVLRGWRPAIYEPETLAFGGPAGITVAHNLFCADSGNILNYARQHRPCLGRRELSLLLCTHLFRAANQEWFECGDIWHRVTQLRPLTVATPADRIAHLTDTVRTVFSYDTDAVFDPTGPLAQASAWAAAFHDAGIALAVAGHRGALERGMRDILTHHVIFHWNRLGLTATTQAFLAHAAVAAILGTAS